MVSNKKSTRSRKRTYTLKARALRQEDVHRRITKAAVHLHGTVGPARTTMNDIAELAGVRRATVYNHFPSDLELIDACSAHWFSENPPPDPESWADIPDPGRRATVALEAMYDYYSRGEEMLEKVLSDAPLVPALMETLRLKWWPMLEGIAEIVAEGWPTQQVGDVELRASLRVALDFFTWQKLAVSGLSNEQAARLTTAWVEAGRTLAP